MGLLKIVSGSVRRAGRAPVALAGSLALAAAGLCVLAAPASAATCPAPALDQGIETVYFCYTGASQTWTVPSGVTSATVTLYGAQGAGTSPAVGGFGAEVTATLTNLTAGSALQVNVGQAGGVDTAAAFGGGGTGDYGGGGATDIRDGSYGLGDRLLVAGGGGGAGVLGSGTVGAGGNADSGGSDGGSLDTGLVGGGGGGGAGSQTGPGPGGLGGVATDICQYGPNQQGDPGRPGGTGSSQGTGGAAGNTNFNNSGGGGGGGYWGGGGGGSGSYDICGHTAGGGGGGGGSSYTGGITGATVTEGQTSPDDGSNGEAIITYRAVPPMSVTTTTLPSGSVGLAYSATLAATGGQPPYTWAVTAGSLPAGLTLDPQTGVISGVPLEPGTSTFTVTVADTENQPETATAQLSIKVSGCATTITGNRFLPVLVRSGVVCVTNARVWAPVVVTGDAVLVVTGSRLLLSLDAHDAGTLAVCGSTVFGGVQVTGSRGLVLIGEAGSAGCAGDVIAGPVSLSRNGGGFEVGADTITGPVSVVANKAARGALAEVAANHIDWSLECTLNSPAPSDGGQPNTIVLGRALGQCSGLA